MLLKKICRKCGNLKDIEEFGRHSRSKDGRRSQCKDCVVLASRAWRGKNPERSEQNAKASYEKNKAARIASAKKWALANPEKRKESIKKTKYVTRWHIRLANQCSRRAKKKGLLCTVTANSLLALFERQGGRCHWLGIPMRLVPTHDPSRVSVDRLNNELGYTEDNVVLSCQFANLGRWCATVSTFSKFLEDLRSHIRSNP